MRFPFRCPQSWVEDSCRAARGQVPHHGLFSDRWRRQTACCQGFDHNSEPTHKAGRSRECNAGRLGVIFRLMTWPQKCGPELPTHSTKWTVFHAWKKAKFVVGTKNCSAWRLSGPEELPFCVYCK